MKSLLAILGAVFMTIFTALLVAGCASTMTDIKLSESHPANPGAAQASYPPSTPFLMAGTNLVVTKPLAGTAPEHERGHPHGTKSKAEEKK